MKKSLNNNSQKISWLKKLGPGLITGAADDDPSGIATYSQAGAQFGYQLLWTILFTYPLMVGIQIVSAKIGRVTGLGLAGNIRKHYSKSLLYTVVLLLLIANIINIAADIAAMGDALKLLLGKGSTHIYVICFGMVSLLLQVFLPYTRYVRILKWLTLALIAYIATVMVVHISWFEVLKNTVIPQLSWKSEYIITIVALFGTTISPYLFFWQASQEVEELNTNQEEKSLLKAPHQAKKNFLRIKIDTYIGMGFSNIVAFCIMLTTAITLNIHGLTHIETSAQAALALKPIAGDFAFWLFSLGIIGTGLLAIPVLAGSAAYAIAETFEWEGSLELAPLMATKFYSIIAISITLGVILCFTPINPIKALYWSAVLNGIMAVPIMVIMMLMASRSEIMGEFIITTRLKIVGWLCTLVMACAVAIMFYTFNQ